MVRPELIGFGPFFSSQLSLEELQSSLVGRAVAARGRSLLVQFPDGAHAVLVPGRLRAEGVLPVVGDFVVATPGPDRTVARVLERRTWLSRNVAGGATAEQVLAANVDVVFVVQGLDEGPNPRRLERTLAAVHAGGAEPVIVLTKPDRAEDLAAALAEARGAAPAVEVEVASGLTGEGVAALAARLRSDRTGVLVGPSGAGKSTLVNALLGREAQRTAPVRGSDDRGVHTTTGRELFLLPAGGALVDGPGIRELRLWDASGLDATFEDLAAIAARCRFRDCSHGSEPGCAVREAIADGHLDAARVESHRKLALELERQAARREGGAARVERARWKAVSKALRRLPRERGR
ncbi:ribosome small subunit-dependent GTPase A [Anaeromyxobacter sp. Fw109-5]|uniref:ribosome small subunit-dependent GTPase A n=1 Tax=Anaeromyxobacter sp. (strain Fw109-5) TaxID=404589 RepID=UPI0000ED7FE5|nr:ribosome small subunit-dependent GTPase A [Anaeromyxobacter sp. Fw109-5]ABS27010.1 ribosome small subunit-dependent GTPase A [Anaeromyxobacter sp. Fw109-5]